MLAKICYSKQRAFLVSEEKSTSGRSIGCFLHHSGLQESTIGTRAATGYYWSNAYYYNYRSFYYYLYVTTVKDNSYVYDNADPGSFYSVRCVRNID